MDKTINSYLTFKVNEERFGVGVSQVLEISEYTKPKTLPEAPSYVKGLISFREEIIPLIDTGIKFSMDSVTLTSDTCVIVLQLVNANLGKTFRIGILVDSVSDVIEASDSQLKSIDNDYRPNYIESSLAVGDQLIYILNANDIFSQKEVISMMDILKSLEA